MRKLVVGLLAVLLTTGMPVVPNASAHPGNSCGPSDGRLEGECYTSPLNDVYGCDPDFDSEHTFPKPVAGASGGTTAFMPHSGCGIRFEGTNFPPGLLGLFSATYTLTTISYRCSGGGGEFTIDVSVDVDGSRIASGTLACSPSRGLQTANLNSSSFPSATRTVDIRYATSPFFLNFEVDAVGYRCVTAFGLLGC